IDRGRVDTAVPGVQGAPNPSRVSCVRNTETPSGSAMPSGVGGKPEVTEAQEANAGGRKATGKRTRWVSPPLAISYNWPDTGSVGPGRESAPTWVGEP